MSQKKKVLLVIPDMSSLAADWPMLPIGIAYISSYMKKQGISVQCLNLTVCDEPMKALDQRIRQEKIDIVATGDMVCNWLRVKEIVDCTKKVSPHIVTIIGGPFVTYSAEEAMQLIPNADYGVIGEGEVTDSELVLTLESGGDPAQVAGIIYRNGGALHRTTPREEIEDLDSLPWPDYEGCQYFEVVKRFSNDVATTLSMTTSRGCPFNCTFCTTGSNKKYRQRSLDSIFEELEYVVEHYGVKYIYFSDELFAVNEARVHEFCLRITPFHLHWCVDMRVGKHIQLEMLREMRDAGCERIFYGLESANDTILKSMKKGITEKEILRVLEITNEAGIKASGNFIFGDTQETLETAEYTMNWIENHYDLLQNVYVCPIRAYPGSELYLRAVRSGKISDTVQFIRDGCPQINTSEQMDDETYHFFVSNTLPLLHIRLTRYKVLQTKEQIKEKIIPEPRERRYKHTYTCKQCGKNVTEYIEPEKLYKDEPHSHCPGCGQEYALYPFFVMLQQYESEIFSLLSQKGCAVWGVGGHIGRKAYYNIAGFRDAQGLILIDRNEELQKTGFQGKTVISPDRLPELGVNKVVCFTEQKNTAAIKESLKGTPVKVVALYELLLEE